jgi:hypothetical protein
MRRIFLAAALLPLGLGACSDGDIDKADIENAAGTVESASENALNESGEMLDEAGTAIKNGAEDAGDAVANATRETGEAIDNTADDIRN